MSSVVKRVLLPFTPGLSVGIFSLYAQVYRAMRGLAASPSITRAVHAPGRRHALVSDPARSFFRPFAAMAQTTADLSLSQESSASATALQQPVPKPEAQPAIQQGFSIPANTSPPRPQPAGFKKTFYKRKLPCPPAIEFSSHEGRQLFQEALLEGSMVGFFKLMEQFNTQDEPAFCGLASLAMVLNALSIDPRRTWKGSWRWFHEAMLDCCRPLDVVKEEGITLYQASCLARCNGARVELRPYGSTTLEQFRREVMAVCRSGEEHIVVSYSRKAFLQTGDGHFSPIGGYHVGRDLVLVLDVARFKYPPHWVPLPMLYSAMAYPDSETGRPRGYMRLASNPLLDSVLLTLDVRTEGWRPADQFIRAEAPALVKDLAVQGGLSGEDVVRRVVDAMPLESLDAFLVVRSGAPLASSPTAAKTTAAAAATLGAAGSGDTAGARAGVATKPAGRDASAAAAASADAAADLSDYTPRSSLDVDVGAAAAACGTAESMADAVRRASEVGNAAAAAAAGGAPSVSDTDSLAAPGTAAEGGQVTVADSLPLSAAKSCGSANAGGGEKPCATNHTCGSGGGAAACASSHGHAPSHSLSHSSNSLMAAATAIFTARDRCIPLAQRQQLLDELRVMPLYTLVAAHLAAGRAAAAAAAAAVAAAPPPPGAVTAAAPVQAAPAAAAVAAPVPSAPRYLVEKVVMALLMQRPEVWPAAEAWRDPAAGAQWQALLGLAGYSVVEAEVSYLREQLLHIDEVLQSGDVYGTCGEHSSRLDCAAHGH